MGCEKKDYAIRQSPEYKQIYLPDALIFEGAGYIQEPEKRNYYGSYGPMRVNTASFQIENGKIEAFMEKWSEIGNEDLKITFYDKGYSQLKKGLENQKIVSFALGMMAVEWCMGLSKKKCVVSMASGILLVFLVGTITGGIGGAVLSRNLSADAFQKEYYDTTYSSGKAGDGEAISIEKAGWKENICVWAAMF